jgi:hypothetical protein
MRLRRWRPTPLSCWSGHAMRQLALSRFLQKREPILDTYKLKGGLGRWMLPIPPIRGSAPV